MTDIAALRLLLNDERQLDYIRIGIVNLICALLDRRQDTLDAWETNHLADAIGALSLNVHSVQQPTSAWLRLCLHDLDLAHLPRKKRPALAAVVSSASDPSTYPQLREAIDSLASDIAKGSAPAA